MTNKGQVTAGERFPRIPANKIQTMVGLPIHLAWANKGCVWILESVADGQMRLRTPKTGKILHANVVYARYIARLDPDRVVDTD